MEHPEIRSVAEELLSVQDGTGLNSQIGVIHFFEADPTTDPWTVYSSETLSAH